jgi:hypothetical protein
VRVQVVRDTHRVAQYQCVWRVGALDVDSSDQLNELALLGTPVSALGVDRLADEVKCHENIPRLRCVIIPQGARRTPGLSRISDAGYSQRGHDTQPESGSRR